MTRLELLVRGIVQGVGFRPFVYREATERGITGHIRNACGHVELEVQGPAETLDAFIAALHAGPRPLRIEALERRELAPLPETEFKILESTLGSEREPSLPADLALCADCARELEDRGDRRYRYPFTNCTRCGPRFTIVEALPYDRQATSMRHFPLCAACTAEYRDPANRRFHAEPTACPECGPSLTLLAADGEPLDCGESALRAAAALVARGQILALKGLGGFQLLVDASDAAAVTALRRRKNRDAKPFAVMFASLPHLLESCDASPAELSALSSPEAPIVLVRRRRESASALADEVAPGNPYVGALLPYTPLHALLLKELDRAVVCTSGNRSAEPMCTDIETALARLSGIADAFLTHDRPIVRPMDDSVARVLGPACELLRRARGYAPEPIAAIVDRRTILGLGAHHKSSVALAHRGQVVLSQHIGDLGNLASDAVLARTVDDLTAFLDATPDVVACDLHPDYASTVLAENLARRHGARLVRIQHHAAHVAAVRVEHGLGGALLGFAWDGTGLGTDGSIWGGEALLLDGAQFERVSQLAAFPLPGGERAAREPRRSAAGWLWAACRKQFERRAEPWFSDTELRVVGAALAGGVNCPRCSSLGRLFDAVAALLGLHERCSFEGQAAMQLEFLAASVDECGAYPLPVSTSGVADTGALLGALLEDLDAGVARARIARRFHGAMIDYAAEVARRVGLPDIVIAGGCFQNALLARGVRERLEQLSFRVHSARKVPCNDGGIAVGQISLASELDTGPAGTHSAAS